MSARTHYAGALVYTAGRGGKRRVEMRGGFPVCCTGPRAEMIVRQGAGRLIRSAGCRGVVVLCDPRVTTKRYGAEVLRALGFPRRSAGLDDALAWLTTGQDQQGVMW